MDYKRLRFIRSAILIIILAALIVGAFWMEENYRISFSAPSGFYNEPFYLEISGCAGGTIHYTLDATEPTADSPVYSGPILITDASSSENQYSSRTDVYIGFNPELASLGVVDPSADPRKVPVKPVDKATIVKAALINNQGDTIASNQATYFVGYQDKDGYEGFGILAISTDPDDLFDYERGIYVTGKSFDEYFASLSALETVDFSKAGNYLARGKKARRKAHICIFNSMKEIIGEGDYEISIQGGFTRASIPRSLNVYSYSGKQLGWTEIGFEFDLSVCTLFGGGNDYYLLLRDAIVNERTSELNFDTRNYIPVQMFLEGEYWGTYYLTEKYCDDYFQSKYLVNKNDVAMIKAGYIEIGDEQDASEWNSIVKYIESNNMNDEMNYRYVESLVDIESCIDYYATEIYVTNFDWPISNTAVWKSKDKTGKTSYHDGRWRWVLYDVNAGITFLGLSTVNSDWVIRTMDRDPMFLSLMDNSEFQNRIEEKLVYLAKHTFAPDIMRETIQNYHDRMLPAMSNDYARFFGDKPISDYTEGCNQIIQFFELRADYILSMYDKTGSEN